MKWSWRIAKLAGIGVYVHWTFLLLVAWIVYAAMAAGGGVALAVENTFFVAAVFLCIVLHELGHALAARRFGIATRDITLLPIGGVARLERMPEDPRQELVVAMAGPAVTLGIALVLLAVVLLGRGAGALLQAGLLSGQFLARLMWVNAILLAFNLVPAFPMDGGRAFRAILHFEMDYVRATQIAARTGQVLAVAMGLFGLLIGNPFLLIIALFVYFAAREEARSVEVRALCEGVPVLHAMVTRFRSLAPHDTLAAAADELIAGTQQDFPVVEGEQIVGLLTRADLIRALGAEGREAAVADVMRRDCPAVEETEMLDRVLDRMRERTCTAVPVVRRGRLAGLLTLENLGEWMMIQSSLRHAKARSQVDDIFGLGGGPRPAGT